MRFTRCSARASRRQAIAGCCRCPARAAGGARCAAPRRRRSAAAGRAARCCPSTGCSTSTRRPCDLVCSQPYTSSRDRTLPAGMPASSSRCNHVAAGAVANAPSISAMSASRLFTRSVFVREPGLVGIEVDCGAKTCHCRSLPTLSCRSPSAAVEQPVWRDGRMVVALRRRHLAGHRPPGPLERVHADDGGEQASPHDATARRYVRAPAARRARRTRRTSRRADRRSAPRPEWAGPARR